MKPTADTPLKILNNEKEDNETGYRALVALGNIVSLTIPLSAVALLTFVCLQIYTAKRQGSLSDVAAAAYKPVLTSVVTAFPEERVKSLVQEIKNLLG